MKLVTATTPYGTLKRRTARKYTHVVALIRPAAPIAGLSWCGSAKLAESQLRYWIANSGRRMQWRYPLGDSWEVQIFPVDDPDAESVRREIAERFGIDFPGAK